MGDEIVEPRLTEKLKKLLDVPAIRLQSPPPDPDDLNGPADRDRRCGSSRSGSSRRTWNRPTPASTVRSRMLVHRRT